MVSQPVLVQPASRSLLARILDEPDLPAHIQALPPAALGALIDRVGLEDAGEIVALATTDQIAHVFDEDLWKNDRPGEEERFDADRFLVWLTILMEAGEQHAASRLAELPEDLVTLALHRHVLVLDVDALAAEMADADEDDVDLTDKALESCLYEELDGYQIVSRHHEGWDTVLAAILALDRDHHAFLVRVLDRCVAMTSEYIESNGGLQEVLTSDEVLEGDVGGDREDRRAEAGYVAPTDAASFLALAKGEMTAPPTEHDPVTRAYFRRLAKKAAPAKVRQSPPRGHGAQAASRSERALPAAGGNEVADTRPGGKKLTSDTFASLLREAGVTVAAQPRQIAAGRPGSPEPLLVRAMRRLAEEDPAAVNERTEELAYLVNVLVAGCSFRGRRLRPVEAASAVIAACSEGLALAMAGPGKSAPLAAGARKGRSAGEEGAWQVLRDHPADGLFRLAWGQIDRDATLAAACTAQTVS